MISIFGAYYAFSVSHLGLLKLLPFSK